MNLFFISDNGELVVDYYNKIKTVHEKNSLLDDVLFKESQVLYARANLVYANLLQSQGKMEESLEYLFLAKDLTVSIPQSVINVNTKISNTYYLMGMSSKAMEFIQQDLNDKNVNQSQKLENFKLLEKIYSDEGSTYNLLSVKDSIIFYNEDPLIKQEENEFTQLEIHASIQEFKRSVKIMHIHR